MRTNVEFRSHKFPAYPGEEESINPGRWGRRLAEYLSERLMASGIPTGEIYHEDWGWAIPIPNQPFPMWVGCACYDEYPDGYLVFIDPAREVIRIFLKSIDTVETVTRVADAIDTILTADPDIGDVRWWANDLHP